MLFIVGTGLLVFLACAISGDDLHIGAVVNVTIAIIVSALCFTSAGDAIDSRPSQDNAALTRGSVLRGRRYVGSAHLAWSNRVRVAFWIRRSTGLRRGAGKLSTELSLDGVSWTCVRCLGVQRVDDRVSSRRLDGRCFAATKAACRCLEARHADRHRAAHARGLRVVEDAGIDDFARLGTLVPCPAWVHMNKDCRMHPTGVIDHNRLPVRAHRRPG